MDDLVYLKNGSIIRGVIMEFIPSEAVKIQTRGGSLFVFEMESVERIAKMPRQAEAAVSPTPESEAAEVSYSATAETVSPGTDDVVYLKDGSIIRGQVLEHLPGQSVKIETDGGNVFVYKIELIERVAKEPAYRPSGRQETQVPPSAEVLPQPSAAMGDRFSRARKAYQLRGARESRGGRGDLGAVHYRKSPGVAGVLSLVVTGAGQIYNEEPAKGMAMMVLGYGALGVGFAQAAETSGGGLPAFMIALGVSIWSITDAVGTANRINQAAEGSVALRPGFNPRAHAGGSWRVGVEQRSVGALWSTSY